MNKQIYFVFGFLSAVLLVSMFASVSAIGWREIFGVGTGPDTTMSGDGYVQLAPMPGGSPYSCSANTDIKTRTLQACQWVRSPLGEFTTLRSQTLDAVDGKVGSNLIVGGQIRMPMTSGAPGRSIVLQRFYDDLLHDEVLFLTGYDSNGEMDAHFVVNGDVSSEGVKTGNLETEQIHVGDGINRQGIRVDSLTGTGNDYACIDANGRLFRSNTAC